ncbi:hypothetical protein PRUPE_1G274000 [Prunus persica]|uniref:Uncharacterized protein n=1 Tax=Prunus persica TaxID=3760 RepID=A0A251R6V2_PRUPE|nr:hypothetical protein PRUPE_1G274000 [Prunus persica]
MLLSNEKMKDQLQRNRWCKCYICIFLISFFCCANASLPFFFPFYDVSLEPAKVPSLDLLHLKQCYLILIELHVI